MSDDDAFLQGIRQNPDDLGRRLVYADWLDDRGDPRGEYLRLSCRMAELQGQIDPAWRRTVQATELRLDDLRLDCGWSVSLRSLRQFLVYGGLLEGLPTREMNERIINRLVAEERGRPFASEPLLLQPEQRPVEYHRERPYPFGEPAAIPGVGCVGEFRSYQTVRDHHECYSSLVVIWFQDGFTPPIAPEVWPQFRAINWAQHAADYTD